jgi:hypothetical protein
MAKKISFFFPSPSFAPHFSLLPAQFASHRESARDDGLQTTQYRRIPVHGEIILIVFYTNEDSTIDANLAIFENMLNFEV